MFVVGASEEATSESERGMVVSVLSHSSMVSRLVLALHDMPLEVRESVVGVSLVSCTRRNTSGALGK